MPESVDISEYPMGVVEKSPVSPELPNKVEKPKYEYIQETMRKVSDQSEANLSNYLDSESFRGNLSVSLIDYYKMELLLKKFPDKKDQILPLIPQSEDKHFMLNSDAVAYRRQIERENLVQSVPWLDLRELEEFNEEARHLTKIEAEELLQKARQEVESSPQEGLVLVVSLNSQDIMKVIQDGQYKASLDNPDLGYKVFSAPSKKKIVAGDTNGLGPLETRYLRELQMGTYPINSDESSIPHPVYGQMIVNQDIGLLHAKEAGYGTLNLRLKTEKIKDRTTFFTGDSINNSWQGQQLGWNEAVKARGILDKLEDNPKVDWRLITPYIEAHVMGGVSMQDIDGCVFESSEKTKELEDYFSLNSDKFEITRDSENVIRVKFKT